MLASVVIVSLIGFPLAGPIVGPIITELAFGWMPAILWISQAFRKFFAPRAAVSPAVNQESTC